MSYCLKIFFFFFFLEEVSGQIQSFLKNTLCILCSWWCGLCLWVKISCNFFFLLMFWGLIHILLSNIFIDCGWLYIILLFSFLIIKGCWVWICGYKETGSWINLYKEITCCRGPQSFREGMYSYYYTNNLTKSQWSYFKWWNIAFMCRDAEIE